MRILSLFDGIACWYEALVKAGIKIDAYYASEIDKYAIQIAQKNHPDIIQVGDICKLNGEEFRDIDLVIGGSPCQWFSVAGKMLNFEDPRSKLFFEFVRILKEVKPKYFLLENVKMKKERQDIISERLGVEPIEINSGLVSGQNRKRLYRTNIPGVIQPEDKGIILKDILQKNVEEKYYYSKERWEAVISNPHNYDFLKRLENINGKCNTLTTVTWGNQEKKIEELLSMVDGELRIREATKKWYSVAEEGDGISLSFSNSAPSRKGIRIGKANTLTCSWESYVYNTRIRKLTPVECERLQTLPDNYTEGVSDTQRYKALGNGWTVDVIAHIFSFIPKD